MEPTAASQASDEWLLRACADGDRAAWNMLVERYAGLVIGTARRAGASSTLADDVMQTVFAVLVRRLTSIRDPAALPQWLIVTTKRTTWRMARAGGLPTHEGGDRAAGLEDETDGADPAPLLVEHEQAAAVRRAVDALGEPCRAIVRALFFEQPPASYAALAERLDVPVGSLGPTRARCLQRLGERFGKRQDEGE